MSHPDTEALAEAVVEELDPGQIIDNKVILSRRQLVAIAGSGLSAGALAALGLEEASAQSGPAGQVGTDSEPVDAFTWDLDVQNGADFNGNPLNNVSALDVTDIQAPSIAENLFLSYPLWRLTKDASNGSVNLPANNTGLHSIQLRQPGDANAGAETAVYDATTEIDPSIPNRLTFYLNNITVGASSTARINIEISDDPSGGVFSGSDWLIVDVGGDGDMKANLSNDGTSSATSDTTQNNAFIEGLDRLGLEWDGSALTVTATDGTNTVTVTEGTNYPTGENLFIRVLARDGSVDSAKNVEFDVENIRWGQ